MGSEERKRPERQPGIRATGCGSSRPRGPPHPRLRPPGGHRGDFLGAGSPALSVRTTDSTTVYLRWANKAAVSGGTLTIFNDSGVEAALQDAGGQAENSRGNSVGGKIKGARKAILTG